MAQYLAVFKHIFEGLARRELLAEDRLDPFLRLLLLLRIALRRDLRRENAALENLRDSDVLERDLVEPHVPGRKLEILVTLVDLETCKYPGATTRSRIFNDTFFFIFFFLFKYVSTSKESSAGVASKVKSKEFLFSLGESR